MQRFNILLVEDDILDAKTVKRAFANANFRCPISLAQDGQDALDFLRQGGLNKRPSLILLDLNMPRKGGIEFLRAHRQDATLCSIPVVVLTTSGEACDVEESYRLGASGYIVKPLDFDAFVETANILKGYWTRCELPGRPNEA